MNLGERTFGTPCISYNILIQLEILCIFDLLEEGLASTQYIQIKWKPEEEKKAKVASPCLIFPGARPTENRWCIGI